MPGPLLLVTLLLAGPPVPAAELLGETGLSSVRRAREIEVMRMAADAPAGAGPWEMDDLPVRARVTVRRDAPLLERIRAALLADDAYAPADEDWEPFAAMAEVGFRVSAWGDAVEMLVCFRADAAVLRVGGAGPPRVVLLRNRDALVALVQEAFPDDRELQWLAASRPPWRSGRAILGPAAEILDAPVSARAFILRPRPGRPREIADLEIASSRPVAPAAARRLAALLADERTYEFEKGSRCTFVPNVAWRMVGASGARSEVIVCFGCNELVVNAVDGHGRPIHVAGGALRGGAVYEIAEEMLGRAAVRRAISEARPR